MAADILWSPPYWMFPCGFIVTGEREQLREFVRECFGDEPMQIPRHTSSIEGDREPAQKGIPA